MPAVKFQDLTLISIIAGVVQAYAVFNPVCSTPTSEQPAHYVGSPNVRGTVDILWSSLFTIFACTWSIQHLNVPEQREGRDPGWRGDILWMMKGVLSKSKWMIITVIAPEVVFSLAADGFSYAKKQQMTMRKFAESDAVEWSLIHCMFADMGGFVIRPGIGLASAAEELHSDIETKGGPVLANPTVNSASAKIDTISANVNRGGMIEESHTIQIRRQKTSNEGEASVLESGLDKESPKVNTAIEEGKQTSPSSGPNPYHLNGRQIFKLRSEGYLQKLPRITKKEINDKSKGDSFAKAITIGQIGWTIIQVCVRSAKGLAIAQLEIAVIAFSSCAILIYAMQWLRPKDVGVPITLIQYGGPIPPKVLDLLHEVKLDRTRGGMNITNFAAYLDGDDRSPILIAGIVLGCLVFGAPHIGAWNFEFPTHIEQTIWRATSLYCTCVGIIFLLVVTGGNVKNELYQHLELLVFWFLLLLYVVVRQFLLVEIFRTLCFLPASGYVSTWAANLPFVG